MQNSIFAKKRLKIEALLNVLGRYQYLLLALVGQIYVLLLISAAAEFYGVLGIPHNTLVNGFSLVSLVVLALLALMQWTYPISNEVPIIVLIVWIMLSTQSNSPYCLCCSGAGIVDEHHHPHVVTTTLALPAPASTGGNSTANSTNATTVGGAAVASDQRIGNDTAVDVITQDDLLMEQEQQQQQQQHNDALYILEFWATHARHCRREALLWTYSVMGVVMLAASLLADTRYYWLALLMRGIVVLLLVVLLLLLVVSPGSCSQYGAVASFTLIARITLYHLLWFMNQYKDVTELVLLLCYGQGAEISKLLLRRRHDKNSRGAQHDTTTPNGMLRLLDGNAARLRRQRHADVSAGVVVQIDDDGDGDGDDDADDHLNRLLALLVEDGHHLYYTDAWLGNTLSWKHRDYGRAVYHLVCLARTVWVLAVEPLLMAVVAPLLACWLLYHIARNKRELRHACKYTGLLEYYLAQLHINK